MVALRSLDPELAADIAAWQREYARRLRDSYICVLCGLHRDVCVCEFERREDYRDGSADVGYDA